MAANENCDTTALRKLHRQGSSSLYVFVSERQGPLTASSVRKILAKAGELAEVGFPVHPHQLRHGCGFKLANDGQDTRAIQLFMGHKNGLDHRVGHLVSMTTSAKQ